MVKDDPWLYTRMTADKLTYWNIMTTRRPFFAFINRMLAFHCIQYSTSIYPQHMTDLFGFDEGQVSFSLLALTGTYFLSCILGPALLNKLPRRYIYVQGLFLATIGYILLAPSTYIGLPEKSLPLVLIGFAIVGFSQGPTVVSTLPEALDTWKVEYDHCEGVDPYLDGMMTDVFASLHINLKCFTAMVAPIVAGALNTNYGYQ